MSNLLRHILITFVFILSLHESKAGSDTFEAHVKVALRSIGHDLLKNYGNDSSRVLPIEKTDEGYKMAFASDFGFDPAYVSWVVDSIVERSQIATKYIVEIEDCDSAKVVYSYEVDREEENSFTPCIGRGQPEACYVFYFKILSIGANVKEAYANTDIESKLQVGDEARTISDYLVYFIIGLLVGAFVVLRIRKNRINSNIHLINLGSFTFDQKNMILSNGKSKQDLTGKETDLLQLLYKHLNSTVDKEVILKEVWRDEGAYIGRTLDVYISKLRKKLESDPAISIINVRGVGYKLTLS